MFVADIWTFLFECFSFQLRDLVSQARSHVEKLKYDFAYFNILFYQLYRVPSFIILHNNQPMHN